MISERACAWPQRMLLLIGLYLLAAPLCFAGTPAGKVIIAAGEAWATDTDQAQRKLKRRSDVFTGETLVTGASGRLQVRFSDGALLDLAANSELRLDDYHFDEAEPGSGRNVATLVKGGFRTITGLIGKQDPEAYRVNTPVATIGVRGTNYEARLGDGLAVGVWKGGVRIHNEAGVFDIGKGAEFNFAKVDSAHQLPTGLLAPPAALEGQLAAPAAPADDAEAAGQENSATGTQEQPAEDAGVQSADAGMETAATADSGSTGTQDAEGATETVAMAGVDAEQDGAPLLTTGADSSAEIALGITDPGSLGEPSFVPDPIPNAIPDTLLNDARLSDLERQRLTDDKRVGMMILSGPAPKNFPANAGSLTGGKATGRDLGPVIATSTLDPATSSFGEFLAAGIESVYRPGAAAQLPPPAPVSANPGFNVEWGAWDASPMTPVEVQTDATDPGLVAFINQPVFWATTLPATKTALDARSGIGVFNNVVAAFGHASSGAGGNAIVTGDVAFTATIDFSTGAISAGQMTVGAGPSTLPEQWLVNFTGQLNGPLVSIDPANITGTVSGAFGVHAADAELGGILTGPNANAIAGGFSFASKVDGNVHAEGLYLVTE